MKDDDYMRILAIYVNSIFQDFKNFLKTEVDLVKNDIMLVLDEYNSSFSSYKITPGIYTFKDLSKALFNILQLEYPESSSEIVIEFDDITRKTKLVIKSGIIAIRFDEKSFFSSILCLSPGSDYKQYIEYMSQKIVNLSTTNKKHPRCDVIDGIVVNGLRQPILYTLLLDKKPGYKVFCQPKTVHYKKNKSILKNITFYLEDDNNKEVDFTQKTLTFTLQMTKIWTFKWACKNSKVIHNELMEDIDLLQQHFLVI